MTNEKILLGMSRSPQPPDTKYIDPKTGQISYAEILVCTCGAHLRFKETVYEHWIKGHFDTPVYTTKEEMMDRIIEKNSQR
jgi:hypothetical protein